MRGLQTTPNLPPCAVFPFVFPETYVGRGIYVAAPEPAPATVLAEAFPGGRKSALAKPAQGGFSMPEHDCVHDPPRQQSNRLQNGISSSMSLLRAPAAATARRGAPDDPLAPKSPAESSEPIPPPPLRPSSMVRFELK